MASRLCRLHFIAQLYCYNFFLANDAYAMNIGQIVCINTCTNLLGPIEKRKLPEILKKTVGTNIDQGRIQQHMKGGSHIASAAGAEL